MYKNLMRIITSIMLLSILVVGCEQPTDNTIKKPADIKEIPTASLGNGFTISNENILTNENAIATNLNTSVNAFINGNKISTGKIENGVLNITIPPVDEMFLKSQLNNEQLKFTFSPNDVKTGNLILTFIIESQKFILVKGNYNTTYDLFNNSVDFIYTNKNADETGTYKENTISDGLPVKMTATAEARFLMGWNKANTKIDITASNTEMTTNVLFTTKSVDLLNDWYYQLTD